MTAAVLHAKELLDPFVELMIPHAGHIETERVHRLDRRLVVKEPGDQRARADQVACTDGDRVRIRLAKGLQPKRGLLET